MEGTTATSTMKKVTPEVESAPAANPVSLFKLFRYATFPDFLFMLLGTMASFLHGAAFPAAMYIFGDITNAFINREVTNTQQQIAPCPRDGPDSGVLLISNFSDSFTSPVNCSAVFTYTDNVTNATCSNFTLGDVLSLTAGAGTECLTNDLFIDKINELVFIFIGIAVGAFVFGMFQIWFFRLATERQALKIRLRYYRAVLNQELAWFDVLDGAGTVISPLSSGIEKIHTAIGDNLSILIQWNSTFLAAIIVGLVREYRLALLLLGVVPFMVFAGYIIGKVGGIFSGLEQKSYALAGSVAQEVLGSIKTVQAFGGEKHEQERYDNYLHGSKRQGIYKGVVVGGSVGSIYFLIFLVYSVSFWFGGYLVSKELAQVGDVITVFFSILIGAFYFGQGGPNLQKLAEARGVAGPIFDVIDRKPPIDLSDNVGIVPENFKPSVELKGVDFAFPSRPNNKVLRDLSLKVGAGQILALVGSSGSGKTSVIKMIQRLYDVESGEVLVGGVNVKELNLKWLRSQIGVVSQEPVLFDTTIAENIRYGREDATLEDIEEAAKKANAHDFITSLPKGYDTNVGEGGAQLSGGQKQRVAIARALVRDPKILLLDEATSALDVKSESLVQEALNNATSCYGRTTIVIAHRLSTIKNAHLIASMEKGSVNEVGTHTELIARNGIYYDLVTAQAFISAPARPQARSRAFTTTQSVYRHKNQRKFSIRALGSAALRRANTGVARSGSLFSERSRQSARRQSDIDVIQAESGDNCNINLTPVTAGERQEEREGSGNFNGSYVLVEDPSEVAMLSPPPSVSVFRLLRLNARVLPLVLLGCLAAILNGTIFPAFAIIFGEILNVFARPVDEILSGIHPWAAAFLGIGIFSALASFVKFVCFSISGTNLSMVIRSSLFKSLLRQELGWFDLEENASSILSTRLAVDAGRVQGIVGIRIGSLMESGVALIFSLAIAFGYSWLTALVILAFMPVMILASALHFSLVTGSEARSKKSLSASTELAIESIDNIETVTAFSLGHHYYRNFEEPVTAFHRTALWQSNLYGITYALSQAIVFFGYIITFRFGAFQVTQPVDSFKFVEFENVYRVFAAIVFAAIGIGSIGAFVPDAKTAKTAASSVFAIIDRESQIDGTSEEGLKPETYNGNVQYSNVFFAYPARPEVQVLKKFNLMSRCIERKTLALVGSSGSGKSTVISLIARFYDPSSGFVIANGHKLQDLNVTWLRAQMAIVSQEPVLFNASIAANIRYGALFREVSDDEVLSAAKAANIHSFIKTLPQGYSTNVGAKGTQLSGGQKQRIAIARALVRDPKVLLLDEATSALDTESEKVVQEALDKAKEGRTTIIIAHRLSTIQNADLIAVIENGVVAELGSHSELLSKVGGVYYKMVYCQNKAWRRDSVLSHLKSPEVNISTT